MITGGRQPAADAQGRRDLLSRLGVKRLFLLRFQDSSFSLLLKGARVRLGLPTTRTKIGALNSPNEINNISACGIFQSAKA